MQRVKTSDMLCRASVFTKTSVYATGVTTFIEIAAIGVAMIKSGDTIYLNNPKGGTYGLTVSGDVAATDTRINITSFDFGNDVILPGALVTFSPVDMFEQYQRKTKGTVGGLAVTATTLGPLDSTGKIDGVDTDYIKVLGKDFMVNDDADFPAQFKDAATTGLMVADPTNEVLAFVTIPYNKKATKVDIYGTNPKSVEVYEMNINANTDLTTATDLAGGTGVMNTEITLTSAVTATATNYLLILVRLTNSNHRIWGGKVTITKA
tara:strand:+ start:716 stop:1507 length:792 start_codon:yes stop_codon:yes gene_type:complete